MANISRNKIIILSLLVLVLISSIVALVYIKGRSVKNDQVKSQNNTKDVSQTKQEEIARIKKLRDESNNAYDNALKNNQPEECLKNKDGVNKDNCLEAFALKKKSEEACKLISSEIQNKGCLDKIISRAAMADKNIKKCQSLNDNNIKVSCVSRLAIELKYSKDKCGELNQDLKNVCIYASIFNKVLMERDTKFCSDIPDTSTKDECMKLVK